MSEKLITKFQFADTIYSLALASCRKANLPMIRMTAGSRDLAAYLAKVSARESPEQIRCRQETATLPNAGMQIGADQGALMAILLKAIDARRYLEIGTFTGYSALTAALALPSDGRVVAIDRNRNYTEIAKRYWHAANVTDKIVLRLGLANDILDQMIAEKEPPFDFIFIDADKINYDAYYERALRLARRGGLIALDNMLWNGDVSDPENQDDDTVALRNMNDKIHQDSRVDMALAALGDGVMLALKR